MKKNIFCRLLSIMLIVAMVAVNMIPNAMAAAPTSYTDISLDQEVSVSVSTRTGRYFRFIPERGGTYEIYSYSNSGDPYVYLLDASGDEIAYSDDYSGLNFKITQRLEAGTTYYINACAYDSSTASYTFKIAADSLDPAPITPITPPTGADVWDGTVAAGFGGGTGSSADPYLIYTAEQLAYLASSTNSGTTYSGKYFKLMSNINLNNLEWTPIGKGTLTNGESTTTSFAGNFDGNSCVIYNLKITNTTSSYTGVFGVINNGTVSCLGVVNAQITSNITSYEIKVGTIAGYAYNSTIERCFARDTVITSLSSEVSMSGGIVGLLQNGSIVSNCFATGSVTGNGFTGGIFGASFTTGNDEVVNCYYQGTLRNEGTTSSGYITSQIGGIGSPMGYSDCICTSFFVGTMSSSISGIYMGGINGDNRGFSTDCYYSSTTTFNRTDGTSTSASNFTSQSWITTNLGWDFADVWTFTTGYDYPVLRGFGTVEPPLDPPEEPTEADVWDGTVAAGFGGGTGTSADPYLIYTAEQLAYLASSTNSGTTYSGKYFKLMSNIDLNNLEWTPIGKGIQTDDTYTTTKAFYGNFDGNGCIIYNLKISSSTTSFTGLFGSLYSATVKNLGIENAVVAATQISDYRCTAGILAGASKSNVVIDRCYTTGTLTATGNGNGFFDIGCIVGDFYGATVPDCYAVATVTVNISSNKGHVGGLFGFAEDDVSVARCFYIGNITSSGCAYINGALASTGSDAGSGHFTNCYYSSNKPFSYATSLTAAQFTFQSSFTNFDFTNDWEMGEDYPVLRGFGTVEPSLPPIAVGSNKILVIMDREPWVSHSGCTSISQMMDELKDLGKIEDWDSVTTSNVTAAMLQEYSVVYVANEQETAAQNRIKAMKGTLEEYVRAGGTLIFGFATMSSTGEYGNNLPGGVTAVYSSDDNNDIADTTHPIITGALSDGVALTEADMNGSSASHDYINASTLPAGSRIIVTNTAGAPTLVEYPLGNGTVIATGMTWEFYAYQTGTLGAFAQKAYDDLFLYALSISSNSGHVHTEGAQIVDSEATCAGPGQAHTECTECGQVMNTIELPVIPHTPGEWVIEIQPTLTTEGQKSQYCTVCSALLATETIPVYEGTVVRVETSASDLLVGEEVTFTVTVEDADPMKSLALVPVFDTDYFEFVSSEWVIQATLANIVPGTLQSVAAWNTPTDINTVVYTITLRAKALTEGTTVDFTAEMRNDSEDIIPLVIGKTIAIVECDHANVTVSDVDADQHAIICARCGYTEYVYHNYDHACDAVCDTCGHERTVTHDYAAAWSNDGNEHWHECVHCGNIADRAEHTYTVVGSTCDDCGYVRYLLGDVDNDGDVDSDDAVYLLYHVMFAADYPVSQTCDFNADGVITSDDAIYLLCYTFFTSEYPLHDAP